MEMTRPSYAVIYVILLCALAKEGSEGKRWDLHQFLNEQCHFSSSSSLLQDGNKLEQVWKHCRKELVDRKHGNQEFEDILCKAPEFLPTQSQQNFLHCISTKASNNAPVSLPPCSASPPSLTNFLTSSGCERHLLADSPDDKIPPITPSSSSAPPPPPPPSSSSSSLGLAGESPSHDTKPPDESPSYDDTKPSDSPSPPSPPKSPERPPPPPPHQPNKNNERLKLTFIAAVTVSAIAALILICLCWGAGTNKVDPKQAQKGAQRAGATLVSADIFYGGPLKSVVLEKFDKKESATNGSVLIANSEGGSLITTETASLLSTGQIMADPPLKPPPGKVAPQSPLQLPRAAPHAPPPPPPKAKVPPVPRKPIQGKNKAQCNSSQGGESDAPKPKLKPFFWDKVNKADQGMVWQQINQGSFQFNEEMIESLFGCGNQDSNQRKKEALEPAIQFIQIIDPRKAQNLSILLRALNVTTEEVVDALKEGSDVPCEIIHALLRMTLTADEELKLRLYTGDLNQLGPAERFLKVVVDIPFAFKRLESLMFITTFTEEVSSLKESFATLEVACNNLRKSRLFLKLLEAVLKTGNRMNDGTYRGGAQAFKLDTLLKLSDVKGTDGRTTLLHFVVQEIIRSEGIRAVRTQKASQSSGSSSVKTEDLLDDANEDSTAEHYRRLGLQVVSGLGEELEDVKKAAILDGEGITSTVSKLGQSLLKSKEFLNKEMKSLDEDLGFHRCLENFVEKAELEIAWLREEDKRIMALVKSTGDYFHGTAEKDEGLRLFTVVRDFLIMLDKACKEVQDTNMKSAKASKNKESPTAVSPVVESRQLNDLHRRLFPAIAGRRTGFSDSSDDDESSSSSSP